MQQTCKITGKSFEFTNFERNILDKFSVPIPAPTLCIEERHRRRLAYRNERKIYNDTCDLSGKAIISLYSPDKPYKVLAQDAWWSDAWDPRDYGRDFDFNRPFFEQFKELQLATPRIALLNVNGENSAYCNLTTGNKNCYLVFGGDYNQDCMYSCFCMHGTDNADVYWVKGSELVYECIDCDRCYNVKYSRSSVSCRDSAFLYGCRNCDHCFGCVGLIGKQYHFFNQSYSPEEYERRVAEYRLESWAAVERLKAEFETFRLKFPHRATEIVNSEQCTGNNTNSKSKSAF